MSQPESWKSFEGQIVEGKFPLRQFLGASDHGAVFLSALPGPQPRTVAVKLIRIEAADGNRQLSQLRTAASLNHPHLIPILETGRCQLEGDAFVYVAMEYAEEDLSQILPQRALSPAEVSDLLPPLLDALSYLHEKGYVHGRVKPSNVLAVGDQLKLSSDQIAPASEPNSQRRRRDEYDAPETAAGIVSAAGDVWSVGVTLVAAITQNVELAHDTSPGQPSLPETVPEPYRGIARECLQLDPQRRCSLAQIQARLQPPARSVPHRPEPLPVPPRSVQRRPVLAITLTLVLAGLVILGLVLSRGKNNSAQNADTTSPPAAQTAPLPAPPARQPVASPKNTPASGGDVVHQVLPDIPQSAKNTITGTIKITARVEVDSSGKVTAARLTSSGPSRYFSQRALKAAEGWEFSPPQTDGQAAPSTWLIHFRLRRTAIQASSERITR